MAKGKKAKVVCECVPKGLPSVPPEVEEGLCDSGGLEGIARRIPKMDKLEAEAKMHGALSDPVRLVILHSLEACGLCPCLLKEVTGLADSKLSYHLGVLEEVGLVSSSAVRRWRVYSLTDRGREWMERSGKERKAPRTRADRKG